MIQTATPSGVYRSAIRTPAITAAIVAERSGIGSRPGRGDAAGRRPAPVTAMLLDLPAMAISVGACPTGRPAFPLAPRAVLSAVPQRGHERLRVLGPVEAIAVDRV